MLFRSDVLLMTSSHEGSPNMVKEALACDLPIVSTDVGDVRERISGIKGCFVSDTQDFEQIVQHVILVLNQGTRIEGRRHLVDLDEKKSASKVLSVYSKAIGQQL